MQLVRGTANLAGKLVDSVDYLLGLANLHKLIDEVFAGLERAQQFGALTFSREVSFHRRAAKVGAPVQRRVENSVGNTLLVGVEKTRPVPS